MKRTGTTGTNRYCFLAVTVAFGFLVMTSGADMQSRSWQNEFGDELYFDGTFYSFRSADEKSAFKIWMPPFDKPVRALLLFGNPGGDYGGDTRSKSSQADMLTFGVRRNIAVGGVTGFPGRDTYVDQGKYILRGLRSMASLGINPELAEIPMIFSGGSNAGSFSYSMASLAPERTIAITPNVGDYFSTDSSAALHEVPMWIHIGAVDPLSFTGVERTEELFSKASPNTVPHWIWDAEIKGHENGSADHVDFAFWDAMLDARLPDATAEKGFVPLKNLDLADGWMADLRTWDHRITRIFPATELPANAEPGRYGWIANWGLARLYQTTATRSRPIRLSLETPALGKLDEGTSGVYLSAGLSTIVDPGETVVLKIDTVSLAFGLGVIEIWDRGEKLGEVDYGAGEKRFRFTVDGGKCVYALYAHATVERNGKASERISPPLQLVVRDPERSAQVAAQLQAHQFTTLAGSFAREPKPVNTMRDALPAEQTLKATWLPAAARSPAMDGALSPVWKSAPEVVIDESFAERNGTSSARMAVRSLWSNEGLYLLYKVEDTSWGVPTHRLRDTVDFHLSTTDPVFLQPWANADRALFVRPEFSGLLLNQVQMQIPVGVDDMGEQMFVNYWNPFDQQRAELTAADHFGGSGIWIDGIIQDEKTRMIELFLPWEFVGFPGLSRAPAPGTRLSYSVVYNDDIAAQGIVWPNRVNPWGVNQGVGNVSPFGQLLLSRD